MKPARRHIHLVDVLARKKKEREKAAWKGAVDLQAFDCLARSAQGCTLVSMTPYLAETHETTTGWIARIIIAGL